MKVINAQVHAVLDYVVVFLFLIAPTLFHLSGLPSILAYTLATVHFGLTLLTNFPGGVLKLVPLVVHGGIEFVVSLVLIGVPWILGFSADTNAKLFYVATGVLIFIVWLLTHYKSASPVRTT